MQGRSEWRDLGPAADNALGRGPTQRELHGELALTASSWVSTSQDPGRIASFSASSLRGSVCGAAQQAY